MGQEIELLEQYGLVTDEDSLRINDFTPKKLSKLYESLFSSVFEKQLETPAVRDSESIDPFTFTASASLRADSTCEEYSCRLKKLDFLGRYTALYANKVMLPLSLSNPDVALPIPWLAKRTLAKSALTLLRLRPLIDAGLVVPVVTRSAHCEHTFDWVNQMVAAVHNAAERAARHFQGAFRIDYQLPAQSPTGHSTLYIEGPDELIEHGYLAGLFDEPSGWRQKSWRFNRVGKVELRGQRKVGILYKYIFEKIADDTTFYLAFGRQHSARYLSDRPGETFLLDALTDDEEVAANNQSLHASLTHLLPLLGDLPIATLLRIRREERDSFIRYRAAVQQLLENILRKKKRVAKREIQELYKENIEPELLHMRSELKQERRRQTRRIVGGVASLAASVAMGVFGGPIPVLANAAITGASAMVGGRLLAKAAEEVCEHGSNLSAKNDFYFLLRVAQEAEMA
ncbi:MAG: hypothetical protein LAP21_01565 [Acidobacteriia bacterium]|nr:hypothetical protein [Terriglobia bacterium]